MCVPVWGAFIMVTITKLVVGWSAPFRDVVCSGIERKIVKIYVSSTFRYVVPTWTRCGGVVKDSNSSFTRLIELCGEVYAAKVCSCCV